MARRAPTAPSSSPARSDELADTLYNVAGDDTHAATRIEKAQQPAAQGHTETSAGSVLEALVVEGRAMLARTEPAIVQRRSLFQLDAAWLDACDAVASRARAAARAVEAPAVGEGGSHADVDLWDGMALALADIVVAAFGKAHAIDARVPKLAFVSLRDRSGDKGRAPAPPKPADDPPKP